MQRRLVSWLVSGFVDPRPLMNSTAGRRFHEPEKFNETGTVRRRSAASSGIVLREFFLRQNMIVRQQVDRPKRPIVDILQSDRHDAGQAVDRDATEELEAKAGRELFALLCRAALLKSHLGAERIVEHCGGPGARVQRT